MVPFIAVFALLSPCCTVFQMSFCKRFTASIADCMVSRLPCYFFQVPFNPVVFVYFYPYCSFYFIDFYSLLPKTVPILFLYAILIAILFAQYLMSTFGMLVLFVYFVRILMRVLTLHRAAMFRT